MSEATNQKVTLSSETIKMLNEMGPEDKPETYDNIIQGLCKEAKGKKGSKGASTDSDNEEKKQGKK